MRQVCGRLRGAVGAEPAGHGGKEWWKKGVEEEDFVTLALKLSGRGTDHNLDHDGVIATNTRGDGEWGVEVAAGCRPEPDHPPRGAQGARGEGHGPGGVGEGVDDLEGTSRQGGGHDNNAGMCGFHTSSYTLMFVHPSHMCEICCTLFHGGGPLSLQSHTFPHYLLSLWMLSFSHVLGGVYWPFNHLSC